MYNVIKSSMVMSGFNGIHMKSISDGVDRVPVYIGEKKYLGATLTVKVFPNKVLFIRKIKEKCPKGNRVFFVKYQYPDDVLDILIRETRKFTIMAFDVRSVSCGILLS